MFFNIKPKILNNIPASETLRKLGEKPPEGQTKISDLIEDFHENGIFITLIFFALPVAIPLPYPPGFTTVMGIPLVILSLQLLKGSQKVWLPQKVNRYEIKNTTLQMISNKAVPLLVKLERYVKPRFVFANSVYCEQFVGFINLISAILVALPIPLTNAVPALGITVMTLGLLNRDGLVIIAGLIVSIAGCLIAISAVTASWVAVKYLLHYIF